MDKPVLDMPFEVKAEDIEESGLFKGYASTFGGKPDAHGDIVLPGAFTKTLAKGGRNGTGIAMLWQHRTDEPIGTWPELVEDKRGLKVTGQLIREIPTGDKAYHLLKQGAVKHLSMGYDTIIDEMDMKKKIRYLKEVDLWEISPVVFPANLKAKVVTVKDIKELIQQAKTERELEKALRESDLFSKTDAQHVISLLKARLRDSGTMDEAGLSIILGSLKEVNLDIGQPVIEKKGVIPFKSYSKAPEGEKWDAGVQVKAASVRDMKAMCTWFNDANPDIKGSYKLPHHRQKGYVTVWRGVANAMARLLQPTTKIPAADKKGCHSHLAKHYREFDKPVPAFKNYTGEEWAELFPGQVMEIVIEDGMFSILGSLKINS